MNKQKLVALLLVINILLPEAAWTANHSSTPVNKHLSAGVSDYRAEFINKAWWDRFNDPILSGYIYKTANDNQDLKVATLKVSEYQALVRESFGKEMPSLGIGGQYGYARTSDNVPLGAFNIPSYSQSSFLFPLTANYELDLWRKNRNKTIRAEKELQAIQYDEKASYIALTSAVASTYFNLIKFDKFVELQQKIVELRKEKLDLNKSLNEYGLAPYQDVIDAEKDLTTAESDYTEYQKQQEILANKLAVITGGSVDDASSLKRASVDDIDLIQNIPTSFPSDVVMKRPDILKSEAELQKARINVKLARRDFLPDINITGQFGFNATTLSKVFKWDSYVASFGVGIAQTLFSGGQRLARLKTKKIQYDEMLQNYQKTILESFQEVNDSMISLKYDTKQNNDYINKVSLEKAHMGLIADQYEQGLVSHLDTLEYRERVLTLEKDQTQSKIACLVDTLSLYKSLGGKL